jgi:hypothetical protein
MIFAPLLHINCKAGLFSVESTILPDFIKIFQQVGLWTVIIRHEMSYHDASL